MFQPQPTPYSPFLSYGAGNSLDNFPAFQQPANPPPPIIDSGGPTQFRDPIFSPVNTNANAASLNYNPNNLNRRYKMAGNDLEQQEALARDFQPSLQGPLVGPKKSSQLIAEEYAKADPIYVAKTAALPQKYSHFRPILGDGNCGWRAIGFSYFETLIRLRNKSQFDAEVARLTSLNNFIINVGGFEAWVFEDMAAETTDLLKDLGQALQNPQLVAEILLQRFNNPEVSNAVVYHLRLLASSWLKSIPDNYLGFMTGEGGYEGYCKEWLEAPNQEIDHLGMQLLIDVLLKPIGFAVEIMYLDRSEGTQVNSHIFQSQDDNGVPLNPNAPTIYLLYKPSHYDILYKERSPSISLQQPMGEAIRNPDIQVNRATNFSQNHSVQNTPGFPNLDMSTLLTIPGFCPAPSHHGFPGPYSAVEQTYTASTISASPVSSRQSPVTSSTSGLSLSTTFPPQQSSTLTSPAINTPHSSHSTHNPFPSTTQLPIHTHPLPQTQTIRPSLSTHTSDLSPVSASSSFRPSKYEWEAAAEWQEGPIVFQTSTFKNSHYNTAHYNNPNFQPEEWSPECEEAIGGNTGRKRSS